MGLACGTAPMRQGGHGTVGCGTRAAATASASAQCGLLPRSRSTSRGQSARRAFQPATAPAHGRVQQQAVADTVSITRRNVVDLVPLIACSWLTASAAQAAAVKAPKGFNPVQDLQDGYQFLYPFGWQEIPVKGTDIAFKDVIEPLETVSITLTPTDKKDIAEYGDILDVSGTLARDVLTGPNQEVKLVGTNQRELKGHQYYEFEFTASNPRYIRHQLAVVAVSNGTLYTLTTGSNEKRWNKMKDNLQTIVRSFQLLA